MKSNGNIVVIPKDRVTLTDQISNSSYRQQQQPEQLATSQNKPMPQVHNRTVQHMS